MGCWPVVKTWFSSARVVVSGGLMAAPSIHSIIAGFLLLILLVVPPTSAAADEALLAAQRELKALGYEPGPADGLMGRQTRGALRAFQQDHGLEVTGDTDPTTLARLLPTRNRGIPVGGSRQGLYRALVIGNDSYRHIGRLENAGADASLVAQGLEDAGFAVQLARDLSHRELKRAIEAFADGLDAQVSGLLYFAGHGVQFRGRNFLVPTDAKLLHQGDLEFEAVDLGWVLSRFGQANNVTNVVVLDACRNNPFPSSVRGTERGLAEVSAPVGMLVAYATQPGNVATDAGIYARAMRNTLRQPNLRIEDLFKQVRRQVLAATDGRQVTWDQSSLVEDLILNPESTARVTSSENTTSALLPLPTNQDPRVERENRRRDAPETPPTDRMGLHWGLLLTAGAAVLGMGFVAINKGFLILLIAWTAAALGTAFAFLEAWSSAQLAFPEPQVGSAPPVFAAFGFILIALFLLVVSVVAGGLIAWTLLGMLKFESENDWAPHWERDVCDNAGQAFGFGTLAGLSGFISVHVTKLVWPDIGTQVEYALLASGFTAFLLFMFRLWAD